jgi:hypothetical protein
MRLYHPVSEAYESTARDCLASNPELADLYDRDPVQAASPTSG